MRIRMSRLLVVVAGCGLVVPAAGAVVIGNWEGAPDGWVPSEASVSFSYDNSWSTLGSTSLKVDVAMGADPWNTLMITNDSALLPTLLANDTFSVDVNTREGDLPAVDLGLHFILGAGGNTGEMWEDYGYRWSGNGTFNYSATQSWTYNRAKLQSLVDGGLIWYQFMIITNNGGASPISFRLDNAQVTPEPASLMLLLAGGLMALRRRP